MRSHINPLGEAATLLQQLVRCDTVNPPGREVAAVSVLKAYLDERGIDTWTRDVLPGRPNLYARVGSDSPVILLNGHTDTVPAGDGWTMEPFGGQIVGDRLYGLGACDMKGGLAASAVVTARLAQHRDDLPGSVLFAATMDEECGATGAKYAVNEDGISADAAIVAEPTNLRVVSATHGQLNFAVELQGRAAHTSNPDAGHSAISDAWRLARLLEESGRPYFIGSIAGGVAPNVVPSSCALAIDRRIALDETLEDVEREFASLLKQLEMPPKACSAYQVTLAVPPLKVRDSHPVAQVLGRLCGHGPPFLEWSATTDASWFAEAGIPAVVFGPGGPNCAHVADEYISLTETERAVTILEAAVPLIMQNLR